MQFEPIDKKFREAAKNHHPDYDGKAWSKMEKLLDKHLPQEDKKRRFIFFWFAGIALIVTGLLIFQPWKSNKIIASNQTEQPATLKKQENPVSSNKMVDEQDQSPEIIDTPVNPVETANTAKDNFNQPSTVLLEKRQTNILNTTRDKTRTQKVPGEIVRNRQASFDPVLPNTGQNIVDNKLVDNPVNNNSTLDKKEPNKIIPVTEVPVSQNETVSIRSGQDQTTAVKAKTKTKKTHSLFFMLGGGPDMSFIKLNKTGSAKFFGGGGVGYTYNNRISLRAGFYSGRKIYTATPEDYNAPAEFYSYYPYLQGVDADCHVYEVPIALSYNFARNSRQNFFASAGVSSYFMKTETYRYYYKTTPTSQTMSRDRTLNDVNTHYFAGLTFSAGYTRNLTRHLSLTVEPYGKLPIKGIGYGKVKLNSAGVLFSLGITPFTSKNK